tara:strand:- start:2993 stop:3319 length:327 start_codon:yes stop_codon:yes gene_type:complete
MELNKFQLLLKGIFNRTESTFNKKKHEYAHNQDVFKSLKNGVGFSFHDEPEQVAYEYLCKHLESIQSILKKLPEETPRYELINEKFGDAINYLIIIEGLLKERVNKEI